MVWLAKVLWFDSPKSNGLTRQSAMVWLAKVQWFDSPKSCGLTRQSPVVLVHPLNSDRRSIWFDTLKPDFGTHTETKPLDFGFYIDTQPSNCGAYHQALEFHIWTRYGPINDLACYHSNIMWIYDDVNRSLFLTSYHFLTSSSSRKRSEITNCFHWRCTWSAERNRVLYTVLTFL